MLEISNNYYYYLELLRLNLLVFTIDLTEKACDQRFLFFSVILPNNTYYGYVHS